MVSPPTAARRRRGTAKSRSGCVRCKQVQKKCDEREPACTRCVRAGAVCDYAFTKLRPIDSANLRQIRPRKLVAATTEERPPHPLDWHVSTYKVLDECEIPYFDRFKGPFSENLVSYGHSSEFWHRTVLREAMHDPCIRDCLVAIGALDCALATHRATHGLASGPAMPLFKARARHAKSNLENQHVIQSIRSYTRALGALRVRLSAYESPDTAADITRPVDTTVRGALIATALFFLFEAMQGNGRANDQLVVTSIRSFKTALLRGLVWGSASAAMDDAGLRHAEMFILRAASFRGMVTPMFPRYQDQWTNSFSQLHVGSDIVTPATWPSVGNVGSLWTKSMTYATTFLAQAHKAVVFDRLSPLSQKMVKLRRDQAELEAYCRLWQDFVYCKIANKDRSTSARLYDETSSWRMFLANIQLAHLYAGTMLDPDELGWDRWSTQCELILDTLANESNSNFISTAPMMILDDRVMLPLLVVHSVVAKCHSRVVREKGLALCQRLGSLLLMIGEWESLSMLMRLVAACAVEESERQPGTANDNYEGFIPIQSRFLWMGFYWDEEYTELTLLTRRVGTEIDEKIVLTLADFSLWTRQSVLLLHSLPGTLITRNNIR